MAKVPLHPRQVNPITIVLLLVLCALGGCNTIARTGVALVQGVQEDISSATRHAGQQASHGTRDAESERAALERGGAQ